jgi:hypothetical protein
MPIGTMGWITSIGMFVFAFLFYAHCMTGIHFKGLLTWLVLIFVDILIFETTKETEFNWNTVLWVTGIFYGFALFCAIYHGGHFFVSDETADKHDEERAERKRQKRAEIASEKWTPISVRDNSRVRWESNLGHSDLLTYGDGVYIQGDLVVWTTNGVRRYYDHNGLKYQDAGR